MKDYDLQSLLGLSSQINTLGDYSIFLGVKSSNERKRLNEKGKLVKDDNPKKLTNAEILFINENGSPLNHIPARPVLDLSMKWAIEEDGLIDKFFDKCMDAYLDDELDSTFIETELKKTAIRLQSHARSIIYDNDGTLAPNSPRVAAKKKGNHPLFDTGQLARSIQGFVGKNSILLD